MYFFISAFFRGAKASAKRAERGGRHARQGKAPFPVALVLRSMPASCLFAKQKEK